MTDLLGSEAGRDAMRVSPSTPPGRRYFLTLAYKGTGFLGWQKQPSGRTVQGVLEEALATILRRETPVTGAGRTDTGVHASRYICHLDLDRTPEEARELVFRANRLLPRDLRLYDIREVRPGAHARFDALSRSYGYYVTRRATPFTYEEEVELPATGLDFDRMNAAAEYLLGTHDFTTFSKGHSDVRTHLCTVTEARWIERSEEGQWLFRITANRFLRNMVRATVGTLFEVGRGKLSPEGFRERLEARDRSLAGTSAPPQGLFLEEIVYPEGIYL